ncbi:hypothetical protein YWS52_09370 [Chitiniphilus shinanonensis]
MGGIRAGMSASVMGWNSSFIDNSCSGVRGGTWKRRGVQRKKGPKNPVQRFRRHARNAAKALGKRTRRSRGFVGSSSGGMRWNGARGAGIRQNPKPARGVRNCVVSNL